MKKVLIISILMLLFIQSIRAQLASDTIITNYLGKVNAEKLSSLSSFKLTYKSTSFDSRPNILGQPVRYSIVHKFYKKTSRGEVLRSEHYRDNSLSMIALSNERSEIYYSEKHGLKREIEKDKKDGHIHNLKFYNFQVANLIMDAYRDSRLEFLGEDAFYGKKCFKFKYHSEYNDGTSFFYFEKHSNNLYAHSRTPASYKIYEDYQKVSGVYMPSRVLVYVDDELNQAFNYLDLELNIEIKDSMFSL
ncbi:MAG: hypothetical protein MI921_24890 [Cytophagales bacterium]|nr:hypothetical protein [Cytophagales bacterium]